MSRIADASPYPERAYMDDLKRLYRQALAARIDALEAAKAAFQGGETDAGSSLRRLAHTLKGSGGTYGFPQITKAAAALATADPGQVIELVDALLEILRDVVGGGGDERKFGLLIIEDDPIAVRIMQARLSTANREIYTAETAARAEELLREQEIDLVLLDLILPDTDGRNFLMRLRERPALAGLPVIITSVKGSAATKTECFALGADEYFEKPIDMDVLAAAVASKLQRTGELARESRTDPLTGLPNRAALVEAFERALSSAMRSGESLCLSILDLDHFKQVNDSHGHAVGDQVLRRLGAVLTSALRGADLVTRWGGEEFVVLFPKAGVTGSAGALRKALKVFGSEQFSGGNGETFSVTFSAGVVEVAPESGLKEAVEEADSLLYLAKEAGRNRVLTPDSDAKPQPKQILLAEDDDLIASVIKHRLGREGFEVHHYPDGVRALLAAPDLQVSLCILDIKMPGIDGFELLGKLRRMPAYQKIPIVMLTALGGEKDIERGFALGADDYIMKPFSPLELLARIRRLIKS